MINDGVLSRFEPLAKGLLKPIYDGYSFGNIANTIEYLLTGERREPLLPPDCFGGAYPVPQKIVLFFIDAFGWQFWQQHAHRYRTTQHVMQNGVLTPISALFPSTTAASVATLHYGVLPAVHAFFEWNIYIPAYGEVIQSLPFCPLGSRTSDACLAKGYDPRALTAVHDTVHQRLARHGVRSLLFSHKGYADSAFNRIAAEGAEVFRHSTLAEALVQLKEALERTDDTAWLNFYWGGIDATGHTYGPGTSYHAAEIASFWRTFDDVFSGIDSADTLYLFTADHGQMYANAADTINLNERIPELAGHLAVGPAGNLIYPTGSPRDVFLHVKPERREETLAALHRHLDDVALIMPVDEALALGLFGRPTVGTELRARLGDILILPYAGNFIWWHEPGLLKNTLNGHHGGLTGEELITVLGAVDRL